MNALESKIAKALGKKRMAKVQDIMDDGMAVDLLLADGFINNEYGDDGMIFDVWDYASDYTVAEIIVNAKRFVDQAEAEVA
jgi:hypothetical protein